MNLFYYIKVGFKAVHISQTCYPDVMYVSTPDAEVYTAGC